MNRDFMYTFARWCELEEKRKEKKRGEKERRRRRKRDVEDRLNVEREPGEKYNDFTFKSV